jgi:hypothetical protein
LQLATREQYIDDFREELKKLKSNYDDQFKEIEEFDSIHSILTRELDELTTRLSQETRDRTTAESIIDSLNRQLVRLSDLREQAGRIPSLVRECEVNTATMVDLRQELESLKVLNRQMHEQQIDPETKAEEIIELKLRLETAATMSQELPTLRGKLQKYEAQVRPLLEAQKRADLLEDELRQTKDRVAELNGRVAGYDDALEEIDQLQQQRQHYNEEREVMMKDWKQAEQACAKVQQMADQLPEKMSKLEHRLQDFYYIADELQSTKTANATLRQTVEKLQEEAALVQQASASVRYLGEEIQDKDAQIVALRKELSRLRVDFLGGEEVSVTDTQGFLQPDFAQETRHPAEHTFVGQKAIGHHMDRLKVVDQTVSPRWIKKEPRKRADRGASHQETNGVAPVLIRTSPQARIPRLDDSHEQAADDEGKSHAAVEERPDKTSIVPESRPPSQDFHQSSPTESLPNRLVGSILSSSPLSDIGELFDSGDMDQLAGALNCDIPMYTDHMGDNNRIQPSARIKQKSSQGVSLVRDDSQVLESQHQTYKLPAVSQRSRPPSSSYGEPLLLDDLEGLGSLPAHGSVNTAPERQPSQSTQDILTSPLGTAPGKLLSQSMSVRPKVPWLSISAPHVDDPIEQSQYSTNPSPRRLRSSDLASRTRSRHPLQDFSESSQNIQPATPRSPMREKNRPNSAIKRKSEAGGAGDDAVATETKHARRNLSNMDIADRRGTATQSLSSSTSDTMRQPISRLRQSSSSSTRGRSTIVGKNAPAPGTRAQGPKKPRGGSKSEECIIITISRGY